MQHISHVVVVRSSYTKTTHLSSCAAPKLIVRTAEHVSVPMTRTVMRKTDNLYVCIENVL